MTVKYRDLSVFHSLHIALIQFR